MNIESYVKKVKDSPFNLNSEVDALILAQSSYFRFEDLEAFNYPISINNLVINDELLTSSNLKKNVKLLKLMCESPRYSNLEILDFESNTDENSEQQFAAVAYRVNMDAIYIAFRGTDGTAIGWKEDLNMSFSEFVPSQIKAIDYVNKIMQHTMLPVYLCGHSKGGNLAVMAASFCQPQFKDRIIRIFNFDGPGFHSKIIDDTNYNDMMKKTTKYIPQASVVGKLMFTSEPTIIVNSKQISIFQHDAFTWNIKKERLSVVEGNTRFSLHFSLSLQKWLENITDTEREYVVDEIYNGFKKLDVTTVDDLRHLVTISSIKTIVSVYNDVDPAFKSYLKEIMMSFLNQMLNTKQ